MVRVPRGNHQNQPSLTEETVRNAKGRTLLRSLLLLIGIPLLIGLSMQGVLAVVYGKQYEREAQKVMQAEPETARIIQANIDGQHAMAPLMQTMSGVVLAAGLFVALSSSRLFAKRFRYLGEASERIAAGQLDAEVPALQDVEFDPLVGDFNAMRLKLQERLALEVERAELGKAMELGAEVQRMFLPSHTELGHPRVRAGAAYRPAATCGGDFWYSHLDPGGRLLVFVGDVTGHGSGAAVVTAAVATQIRMQLARDPTIEVTSLLDMLNRSVLDLCDGSYRMTMAVVEITPLADTLRYHSAGAPPIVLGGGNRGTECLTIAGTPLGSPRFEAASLERALGTGTRIHIFTDGLMEAQREDGRTYGLRRLGKCLEELASTPVESVCQGVVASIDQFAQGAPQDDDYTLLLLEVA